MNVSSQLTRRLFVGTALSLPLAGATCNINAAAAAWVAGIQALGQEFAIVEPELVALGLKKTDADIVAGIARDVRNVAAAISAASTATEGESALVKVEGYINALVPIIWPIVQPLIVAANPGAGLAIGLIVAALPAIEGALNFAIDFGHTLLTQQAQALARIAPRPMGGSLRGGIAVVATALTPDEALALLIARAGR